MATIFNRHDPAKNFESHRFVAGRGLQSAELNEIQSQAAYRLKGIADGIFKDGDIIRDCVVVVNPTTGVTSCEAGAIYISGAVRGVVPRTFTIPVAGDVAIGIRLKSSIVTHIEDPTLLDPATGTRNYNKPGAERQKIEAVWGWDGDGEAGEFFPVYAVKDGLLLPKEAPPTNDAVTQALARYDRDSAGGTYVVSGLTLQKLADSGANQVYSLAEGRARVYGYGIEFATSKRILHAAVPDLKLIANEPMLSTTAAAQRVNLARTPATNIAEVTIVAEKTVTLTHGIATGAQDPIPDTSILSIVEVKQGATTYTATTDYLLTAGKVDWTPAGAEPAPGSTYTVKYRYETNVTPTSVDDDGYTVTGAVVGTLIHTTYSQKLPRYDRLCLTKDGETVWALGVPAEWSPQPPTIPGDVLSLATVYQNWRTTRTVTNDSVRVVPMPVLAGIEGRIDYVLGLVAQQRLESSIHTRESGTKKGIFVDPFLDESQRDAGTPQTAAVIRGELHLPIAATVHDMGADITAPATLAYTQAIAISQPYRTGAMKINPYLAFDQVPAKMSISPAVDRWTVADSVWTSPSTARFVVGSGDQSVTTQTERSVLLGTISRPLEYLRPITISYRIEGFGPGENLQSLTFDGIALSVTGLTANSSGVLSNSLVIPANVLSGNKLIRAVGAGGSSCSAVFSGQGTLERQVWQQQITITTTRWQSPPPPPPPRGDGRSDPLAQTFTPSVNIQASGIDLWFSTKPTTTARVQIRNVIAGVPGQDVLTERLIEPSAISAIGSSTRIVFDAPVALIASTEYAVVTLCDDAVGALSVAELGKFDSAAQRWITTQPYLIGVLLSSSNASTWTAHQDKDLAFSLLRASYTQNSRTISLGNVAVAGATDLLLMSYAERPASETFCDYVLTLPDGSQVTASDGQTVQLATAITGNVGVQARLSGSAQFSPVLHPGSQLVAGQLASTGTYVSRAIPAGSSATVKVVFEGNIPSGATVLVQYKGPDAGDTWQAIPQTATASADDGFIEFTHAVSGVNEATVQIRITLNGTPAARPRLRDLRALVL